VVFRGINKQRIFEEDRDYEKFLYTLQDQKGKSGYELYAYCLMSNHIHLLLREGTEELGTSFRRIASKYVQWYNQKYERVGHLFQDRFKSEVVEDNRYFLGVLRYIHQNPVKAGMVQKIEAYPWSSYREYFESPKFRLCSKEPAIHSIVDPSKRIFSLRQEIGKEDNTSEDTFENRINIKKGINLKDAMTTGTHKNQLQLITEEQRENAKTFFREFHRVSDQKPYLEYDRSFRWTDDDAADFIKKKISGKSPTVLQQYDVSPRNEIIQTCKDHGISLRQLERITGINYNTLRKI